MGSVGQREELDVFRYTIPPMREWSVEDDEGEIERHFDLETRLWPSMSASGASLIGPSGIQ